jgi:hypothetical protein
MKTIRFYSPEDSIKVQDSLENFFGTIRSQGEVIAQTQPIKNLKMLLKEYSQ